MVQLSSLDHPASANVLVYLEVRPCMEQNASIHSSTNNNYNTQRNNRTAPIFLASAVKVHLLECSGKALLQVDPLQSLWIHWDKTASSSDNDEQQQCRHGKLSQAAGPETKKGDEMVVVWLPHLDPTIAGDWPCECHGFVVQKSQEEEDDNKNSNNNDQQHSQAVVVTEETIVRIVPPKATYEYENQQQTGELPASLPIWSGRDNNNNDVMYNHNEQDIQQLILHLQRLAAVPIRIGTGPDANQPPQEQQHYWRNTKTPSASLHWLMSDRALLVHSPDHGAGKTRLVEEVMRTKLECDTVHVIQLGPLTSRHGVYADLALETMIHQAILSAAVRGQPICILIDQLEAMVSPQFSDTMIDGDPASPILSSMALYLRTLTSMLKHSNTVPFPMKNPMYNLHGKSAPCHTFPVKLYLVAIATCQDDGGLSKSSRQNVGNSVGLFDLFHAAQYRLKGLTAQTRCKAFRHALDRQGIPLSCDLESRLVYLSASAVWAKGRVFEQVATSMRRMLPETEPATEAHFTQALHEVRSSLNISSAVEYSSSSETDTQPAFSQVGGNRDAIVALEEAISADQHRHQLLTSFGMMPPRGVLLYGPPGTGKTLLARAASKMLRGNGEMSSRTGGGTFVSIASTDVARAEIGTGEKLLKSAFESARLNAPAVVFIDEFQALFTDRSSGSGRLTSTLMTMMDDCAAWEDLESKTNDAIKNLQNDKRVIVLAATNTPWMIDKAFLRTGRFDRIVHVGLPNEMERHAILRLQIGKMQTSIGNGSELDAFCQEVAADSHGYSGADLAALCRSAAILSLLENSRVIEKEHFLRALQNSTPSSDEDLVDQIRHWRPI